MIVVMHQNHHIDKDICRYYLLLTPYACIRTGLDCGHEVVHYQRFKPTINHKRFNSLESV